MHGKLFFLSLSLSLSIQIKLVRLQKWKGGGEHYRFRVWLPKRPLSRLSCWLSLYLLASSFLTRRSLDKLGRAESLFYPYYCIRNREKMSIDRAHVLAAAIQPKLIQCTRTHGMDGILFFLFPRLCGIARGRMVAQNRSAQDSNDLCKICLDEQKTVDKMYIANSQIAVGDFFC